MRRKPVISVTIDQARLTALDRFRLERMPGLSRSALIDWAIDRLLAERRDIQAKPLIKKALEVMYENT
jgi:metal-responsive CopG/Arc/MetJ family transcriptional regulator